MKIHSQSGSILLSTVSFIILLTLAAVSILELTWNSYKLTMRNELRAQARIVAESELESIFFQWKGLIMAAVPASTTPASFAAAADYSLPTRDFAALGEVLPTTPQTAFLKAHRDDGWQIKRSINYNPTYDFYDGVIPNTQKQGKVTYITMRVEVMPNPNHFFRNEAITVRVGRRFATTNTSIFQYGVFYQGDLEMAPGNDITITGDVVANGSIYAASSAGSHLTLNRQVRYLSGGYFNHDSLGNTVLRKPDTPIGGTLVAPVFGTSEISQVSPNPSPENLLGGLDAAEIEARRPDLFPTENDVYRAAILPPPNETDEYPTADSLLGDDPVINVSRMYTRAGLRVTVNTDNTVTFTTPDGTDVTSSYGGVVVGTPNTDVYDQREAKNVKMTTIDMGALITAINSAYPSDNFNGAIYFNVKSSNATTPRGVKLTNGADVYGRGGNGTTVTTNGGLYIQGDYNTTSAHLADGSTNPAMLMGDQITALSAGWDDANAASAITARVASGNISINAGILTGNTSATATQASGGAQNLVRYLENWNGRNVNVYGSLGRLFESKSFHSVFQQPGAVYGKPTARNFTFDNSLLKHPPAGSPTTTGFSRGSFFVW